MSGLESSRAGSWTWTTLLLQVHPLCEGSCELLHAGTWEWFIQGGLAHFIFPGECAVSPTGSAPPAQGFLIFCVSSHKTWPHISRRSSHRDAYVWVRLLNMASLQSLSLHRNFCKQLKMLEYWGLEPWKQRAANGTIQRNCHFSLVLFISHCFFSSVLPVSFFLQANIL